MKSLTIRARIITSFAVVLALMAVMAGVAYSRLLDIEHQANFIATDTVIGLTYANQLTVDRITNYSLTQEFALQSDPAAKQRLQTAILANRGHLDTLISQYLRHVDRRGRAGAGHRLPGGDRALPSHPGRGAERGDDREVDPRRQRQADQHRAVS